jgi:hypothetical protein
LVHSELLAQGEVLQGELAVAAAEEGQETEQVEQEGDHRAGIVSRSELKDQPLGARTEFWRRLSPGADAWRHLGAERFNDEQCGQHDRSR